MRMEFGAAACLHGYRRRPVISFAKPTLQPIGVTASNEGSRALVKHHVVCLAWAYHEVVGIVVTGIQVEVMHDGTRRKLSPKSAFSDAHVLVLSPPGSCNHHVSEGANVGH